MKDKNNIIIILVGFLLVPYMILSRGLIHAGHCNALYVCGLLTLGAFVDNKWIKLFVWYLAFYVFSAFFFMTKIDIPKHIMNNFFSLVFYSTWGIFIYAIISKSNVKKETVYNFICVAAILQSLIAIMQTLNFDPYIMLVQQLYTVNFGLPRTETVGTLGNNNFLACYVAISLPFFFRRTWCYFIPVIIALLFIANTATAMVAMLVGVIYYIKPKIKWRWIGLALLPFIAHLIMTKKSLTIHFFNYPLPDRFQWWIGSIKTVIQTLQTTIFGMGPGSNYSTLQAPLHNEWIQTFYYFGLIGVVLLLGFVFTISRKNRILYASFLIASICCMGTYMMHLAPSAFLIVIVLALLERERLCRQNHIPSQEHILA